MRHLSYINLLCDVLFVRYSIVAYVLKAGTVKLDEGAVARERLCKHACC
jgi:hypothetical protein